MNSTVTNIIYTHNRKKGTEKIQEIKKEKNKQNIPLLIEYWGSITNLYVFSDEKWMIIDPYFKNNGYRYKKCYIDKDLPKEIIDEIILPCGINRMQEEEYF